MLYADKITSAPVTVYKRSSTFRAARQQPPRPSTRPSAEAHLKVFIQIWIFHLSLVEGWKLFTWSSLYYCLFNRSDHCNHAEGSTRSWMPPEPRSGSPCKWNILILSLISKRVLYVDIIKFIAIVGYGQYQACYLLIFSRWRQRTNEWLVQAPAPTPALNLTAPTLTPMRWVLSLSCRIQQHLDVSYWWRPWKLLSYNSCLWFLKENHHQGYNNNNNNSSYNFYYRSHNYYYHSSHQHYSGKIKFEIQPLIMTTSTVWHVFSKSALSHVRLSKQLLLAHLSNSITRV